MKMPEIAIPDRLAIQQMFPDTPDYHYSENVEKFAEQLPVIFRPWFESFGQGAQTDPPVDQPPPKVIGTTSNIPNYIDRSVKLRQSFEKLEESGRELLPVLRQLREWNKAGVNSIASLINRLELSARQPPPPGMKEDEYILGYVAEAVDAGATEMVRATSQVRGLVTAGMPKVPQTGNPGQQQPPPQPPSQAQPQLPPPVSQQVPNSLSPQPNVNLPPSQRISDPNELSPRQPNDSAVQDKINRAIDSIQNQAARSTPPPQPNPPMSPYSPGTGMGGMDALGPMLGPLMNAAQMRQMADPYMNQRPPAPRRLEQGSPPPPPAKPQPAAPPTNQQQPAKPATPANAQPISNVSSTPGTANGQPGVTPSKVPDADGSMMYTYPAPDGRSQRVSPIVYEALDVAFADKSGADAKHAYEKTKAKWADDKQIGRRVDPNELMTGDVVIWDKRTALLVVFPPDQGGTVEAIVNGEKKPLADLMAAESDQFGEFLGFAHPAGIELAGAGTKDPNAAVVDPLPAAPAVTTA
ncbi:hypothetical protein [Nocardia brasiliensis]|uniref:hypothetical protein n=1 Tax=Nocardia brasiliensis TaxID=37326 RepID=UPI002455EE22|nr:hypothetical protein [Nocardia brasiliensis]